jgi:hypothetical protein
VVVGSLATCGCRAICGSGSNANNEGLELLKRWLSRDQLNQFETKGCFDVIGCDTGRRYRIVPGAAMNVYELDEGGVEIGWCFVPDGYLAIGDVMLAQKIALETSEQAALEVAHNFLRAGRRPLSGASC